MARLPFPDVPVGPLRDLLQKLHNLHARAGWPGTRKLSQGELFSHAAVHDLFTKANATPRLPVLLAVVEKLCELAPRVDTEKTLDEFDSMWTAAVAAEATIQAPSSQLEDLSYTHLRRRYRIPEDLRLGIHRGPIRTEAQRLGQTIEGIIEKSGMTPREVVERSRHLTRASLDNPPPENMQTKTITTVELRQIIAGRTLPAKAALRTILLLCDIPAERVEKFLYELRVLLPEP